MKTILLLIAGIILFFILLYPAIRIIARAWYRSYIEEITNVKNEGDQE